MKKSILSLMLSLILLISINNFTIITNAESQENLIPVYVEKLENGEVEDFSCHWQFDNGEYTRINDTENVDPAESQATLFYEDVVVRYFEMSADIKVGNHSGLTGFIFGAWDIFGRFSSGAEAMYFTKDKKLGFWGSHLRGPGGGREIGSQHIKIDEYMNVKLRVEPEFLTVFIDDNQVFKYAVDESQIFEGRVGIFTTKVSSSFKNVTIKPLNEAGEEVQKTTKTVKSIAFNKESHTVNLSEKTYKLNYSIEPSDAYNKNVSYVVDNYAVASVSRDGVVSLLDVGVTDIYVFTEDGRLFDTILLKITQAELVMEDLKLNKSTIELNVGDVDTLVAFIEPVELENYTIRWQSSNTAVVMVNGGNIRAVGEGEATITITDGDKKFVAECTVVVKNPETESGCNSNIDVSIIGVVLLLAVVVFRKRKCEVRKNV